MQQGLAAAPGGITTPTAQGFGILNAIPGLSATNLSVFNLYIPVAPVNDAGHITVNGVAVPIGNVTFAAPNFLKQNNVVANIDYNQSTKTTHRWRFNLTNNVRIDATANLPVFFTTAPIKQRLFSYSLFHTFTSNLSNETRIAYRRSETRVTVGPQIFPGLDSFPNIDLDDLGISIGPNGNAPQSGIENNYQIVDNITYLWGNHSLKVGADFRRIISPQRFVQRERGEYEYSAADLFLRDVSPDLLGQRNVGGNTYYGNQKILYAFAQDDWRIHPNVTLNLGLGYSYQQIPVGVHLQALNAAASVPGLITFGVPKTQTRNFAPKFGIAYSPNFTEGMLGRLFGSSGQSSIRAGFSMAYDYLFDNIYTLSNPPQAQQTIDLPDLTAQTPNFIAHGAIPNVVIPANNSPAQARQATSAFVPDQMVPYSLTWTISFQRQFLTNWSVEARYLGTRGIHLLTQNRLNRVGKVGIPGNPGLPTFFAAPTQAQIDALSLNLAQINARSSYVPAYANAGFNLNNLITFLANGNSVYHGGSIQLARRYANGFQGTAAYTWSHLIDDTTAEVFSTVLSPRRVEEFQDLRRERADSALDRRHRFVFAGIYELPFFRNSSNHLVRTLLGGFNFAGTWTLESGEKATVLSGVDSNLNADAASDRTIRNPAGVRNTGSTVTALLRTCTAFNADGTCAQSNASRTVGYVANNPNAEYIQAGAGAASNSARNTLQLPGINNVDFSIFKNFRFGENKKIQLRADFFNAFNHPQFVPGSVNDVAPVATTTVANLNTVGRAEFNRPDIVFAHNARVIQMALRFDF